MNKLFSNIRFYVLVTSVLLSVVVYFLVSGFVPEKSLQIVYLTQSYALISLVYLYLALLATPLTRLFLSFPFRGPYVKARRAIGVSACYFALLHAYNGFFGELGGFAALPFLNGRYLVAITISTIALIILLIMALTSFDAIIARLTFPKWKMLHRFVYLVGVFVLLHATMIGSHFATFSDIVPMVVYNATGLLLFLEAFRFDIYTQRRFLLGKGIGFGGFILASIAFLTILAFYL